jgi:hypothetical protein
MGKIACQPLRTIRYAAQMLLPVLTLAAVAAAQEGTWEIGRVDGSVGSSFSSLRIDKFGNAHVSYIEEGTGTLQYSFWDHRLKKWFTTTLEQSGAGFCSLALDSKQHPHISYNRYDRLIYAHWDGSAWQNQTIQLPSKAVRFYTSIALDSKDNPSIGYYEVLDSIGAAEKDACLMRVVTWTGSVWELTTADHEFATGKFNSIAVDSAGRPHVAYANIWYEAASLRFADWDGTSWHKEILEGPRGTYRQAVILILDKQDNPHIAYSDLNNMLVKYGTRVAGKWQMQAVASIRQEAYPDRNGIALDEHGAPYISFFDRGIGVLKVAYRKDQKWLSEVVDTGSAGFTSSIQIHEGTIWLTYSAGPGGGLKFARRPLAPPAPEIQPQGRSVPK